MRMSPEMMRRGSVVLAAVTVLGSTACSPFDKSDQSPEVSASFTPLKAPIDTTPIRLQIVDADVTGKTYDEKPEDTLEKDQYFDLYAQANPASTQEIREAMQKASSGRYIPGAITTEVIPAKAQVNTCFDRADNEQIDSLRALLKKESTNQTDVVVLNAEICSGGGNYPVAGFAIKDDLTVLGREAFVDGQFTQFLVHEIAHQKNNAPHSGEALCEDSVTLQKCTVDAEGNVKSPMSYEQTASTPEEYRGILTALDLYKMNLLHSEEVVSDLEIGESVPLADMASEGVKVVVDTSGPHTVYFALGKQPELSCKDKNSDSEKDGSFVAVTSSVDSANGNIYVCRSPKEQGYTPSVDVYFDAKTDLDDVRATDTQDATTAIVNTEQYVMAEASEFSPQTQVLRPVPKSIGLGRVYDSGSKAFSVTKNQAGQFILTVVPSSS